MQLKRSDVVFMGPSGPEVCKEYMATVVSWGGRPWGTTEGALKHFNDRARAIRGLGIKYLPGAAFRTASAGAIDHDPEGFKDSICYSLHGEPILVPWLWDHEHKGHPAYWFCTNAPGYRDYLRAQMKDAFAAGAEGLHIDDYGGTFGSRWAGGGCFCRHCLAAFREHLKEHGDAGVLAALGIDDLDAFDYGQFLRDRGVTDEQYKKEGAWNPEKVPLSHEYEGFQLKAATEWVAEYRRYCEGIAGHALALCVNSAVSGPDNLVIAQHLTFFSGEVHHEAEEGKVSLAPVWTFKLGDAVELPMACTGAGWDWAYVNEHNKPGLVRTWIAQAYAFGHFFMPPVHQWCYTKEKGTHWWEPDPKEFSYLTRFIRENAELFDDYESVAQVGLVYSNAGFRQWKRKTTIEACRELAEMNVPFRVVAAGDKWIPQRLDAGELGKLRAVIVADDLFLDAEQQAALDAVKSRVVRWPDEKDRLQELAPPAAVVDGAEQVTVVPRVKPDDPAAPVVVHLCNRNYDLESDAMVVQRDFRVWLAGSLLGRGVSKATLHAPGAGPVDLDFRATGGGVEVTVPELDLWGIVVLE